MRVVEVIKGFGVGGSETSIRNRLRFAPKDVNTRVVVLEGASSTPAQDLQGLAPVTNMPRGVSVTELAACLHQDEPDVILVHNPLVAVRFLPALPRRRRSVVIVAHGARLSDSLARDLALRLPMRRVNSQVAGHIAVSQAAAKGPWCAGSRKVVTVPLGSMIDMEDTDYASPWPRGTRIKCLALGRLSSGKRVLKLAHEAIRLSSVFRTEGAHLAIVGCGPQDGALRRKIEVARAQDFISLHPATLHSGPYFREADWLMISSRHEGGPLTAYESAIAGAGIAGTPVGVLPEMLNEYPASLMAGGFSSWDLRHLLMSAIAQGGTSTHTRALRAKVGGRWHTSHLVPRFYEAVRELSWDGQ